MVLIFSGLLVSLEANTTAPSVGKTAYRILAPSLPSTNSSEIRQFQIPTPESGPNAIVSGPNDTLWFVEYLSGKIGEFFVSNSSFREFQIPESGAVPSSLALDHFGNVWFSDQKGSGSIWMLNPSTDQFRQFNTTSKNSKPLFILVDNENDIWFTEITTNKIGVLIHPNYNMIEYTLPTPNSEPVELSFGTNQSRIWITETNTGKIAEFNTISDDFLEYSPPPSVSLKNPVGIVVDDRGNVWVSEHGGSGVVELIPSNSTFRKFPTSISPSSSYPISAVATLAIDSQGRLWFVEHFSNKVGRLDPSTGMIEEFQIPNSGLAYSVLNTLDPEGNFWFTNFAADTINEIPSNASSPVITKVSLGDPIASVSTGETVNAVVSVTNTLSVPIVVNLGASSSFTSTGVTSSKEVSFNASSLDIPAGETAYASAKITPDTSLSSGTYSVGIVASANNESTIGIAFLSVRASSSVPAWFESNYPFVLVGVIVVLIVAYFAISTVRPSGKNRKEKGS